MEPAQTRFDLFSRLLFIISAWYMAASQGQGCAVYLHAIFSHHTHGRSHLIYKYRCGETSKIHISSFPLSFPSHFVSLSLGPGVQLAGPASARLSLENPSLHLNLARSFKLASGESSSRFDGSWASPRAQPQPDSLLVAGLTHWPPDLLRSLEDPCWVGGEQGLGRVSRLLWPCKKALRW